MMPPMFDSSYHRILWEYNERYVADGGGAALSRLMEIEHVVRQLKNGRDYVLFSRVMDEKGNPCDFEFVYFNYVHSEIEGVPYGTLIGKRFYEFFENADPFWLPYYVDTAYNGTCVFTVSGKSAGRGISAEGGPESGSRPFCRRTKQRDTA